MTRSARRIKLEPNTDLAALVEEVRADHDARVLERNGEDVAVIVSAEDYAHLTGEPKSKRLKEKLLAMAGVWSDLDGAQMIETIYRHRHEAPSSPPISL